LAADLKQETSASNFGLLYTIYSDNLTEAISSNCEVNPGITYAWIEKSRLSKMDLAEQVKKIDTIIADYITELENLKVRYEPAINKPTVEKSQNE
jgi:hypothetical protein